MCASCLLHGTSSCCCSFDSSLLALRDICFSLTQFLNKLSLQYFFLEPLQHRFNRFVRTSLYCHNLLHLLYKWDYSKDTLLYIYYNMLRSVIQLIRSCTLLCEVCLCYCLLQIVLLLSLLDNILLHFHIQTRALGLFQ